MVLADTLSRLPNRKNNEAIELHTTVNEISSEDTVNIEIDLINFGTTKRNQLKTETTNDPILNTLK